MLPKYESHPDFIQVLKHLVLNLLDESLLQLGISLKYEWLQWERLPLLLEDSSLQFNVAILNDVEGGLDSELVKHVFVSEVNPFEDLAEIVHGHSREVKERQP